MIIPINIQPTMQYSEKYDILIKRKLSLQFNPNIKNKFKMCHVYNATLNEYRELADVDYSSSRPNCGLFRITGIQDAAYSRI